MWNVSKENSADLGFALSCLFLEAITFDEFKKWLYIVISDNNIDDIPIYIYELLDFDKKLYHIYNVIGYTPISCLNEYEKNAIIGIAFLRKENLYDVLLEKNEAIKILENNIYIYEKFVHFFPFIDINVDSK